MKVGIYIKENNNEDFKMSISNICNSKIVASNDFEKLNECAYIIEVSDNGYFNSVVLNEIVNSIVDLDYDCYTIPYLKRVDKDTIIYLIDTEKSVSCIIRRDIYNGDYAESICNCKTIKRIVDDWCFYIC